MARVQSDACAGCFATSWRRNAVSVPSPRAESRRSLRARHVLSACLSVGVVVTLVGGCGDSSTTRKREELRAKLAEVHADDVAAVEEAFGNIMKARLENDHPTLFDLATELEQDNLAGLAAFSAAVLAPDFPQLKEALAKYGIDDSRLTPIQSFSFDNPNSLRLAMKSRQGQLIEGIDDKRAFYLDVMPQVDAVAEQAAEQIGVHVKQLHAETQQAAREAKLVEPMVMGDTVRTKMRTRMKGQPVECVVTFKRVDGKWLLHSESVFNPVK